MKPRHAAAAKRRKPVAMIHCLNCGVRLMPKPREMRGWRLDARLSQREMGKRLGISAAYIAYLESGKRQQARRDLALLEVHPELAKMESE